MLKYWAISLFHYYSVELISNMVVSLFVFFAILGQAPSLHGFFDQAGGAVSKNKEVRRVCSVFLMRVVPVSNSSNFYGCAIE